MPYIKPDERPPIDALLKALIQHLSSLPLDKQDGALNYTVTKILKDLYKTSYFDFNRSIGVLSAIQLEWYRKHVGPYEDQKIAENGDV